ncbi:MAG: metalloregulator ArsR/SmtB family transcription factor [Thermodesulfobacteriaceae bacterium]|nr:metalloregulator ArsR/SmtB family transcription factor [Thermodesulfobacteriaceae bacterium]
MVNFSCVIRKTKLLQKMEIKEISKKLEALATTSRLKILCLLSIRAFCVCELVEYLKLSQPTLTRHLQILEEAGFVKAIRHKFYTFYSLNYKDPLNELLFKTLLPFLQNTSEYKELNELYLKKGSNYPLPPELSEV